VGETGKRERNGARRLQSEDPGLEVVHPRAAGIDVGNAVHYVAVRPDRDPDQYAGLSVLRWSCIVWLTGYRVVGVKTVAIAYASYCTSLGRCETFSNRSLFDNLTPLAFFGVRILGPRRGTRPSRCINGRAEDRRHARLGPAW